MEFFTYEANDTTEKFEKYEWDSTWIEHAKEPDMNRVLYIGDSISCQVRHIATKMTEEQILFDGFGTAKGIDNPYFKDSIKLFARQEGRRDAVLFNNGLHGWHLDDDTQYAYHYEEMIKFLKDEFENTPIFIVLTTHVAKAERTARIVKRNKAAKKIADKYGLNVIDLHTLSSEIADDLLSDGVHFKNEGYEILAKEIIKSISEAFADVKI